MISCSFRLTPQKLSKADAPLVNIGVRTCGGIAAHIPTALDLLYRNHSFPHLSRLLLKPRQRALRQQVVGDGGFVVGGKIEAEAGQEGAEFGGAVRRAQSGLAGQRQGEALHVGAGLVGGVVALRMVQPVFRLGKLVHPGPDRGRHHGHGSTCSPPGFPRAIARGRVRRFRSLGRNC